MIGCSWWAALVDGDVEIDLGTHAHRESALEAAKDQTSAGDVVRLRRRGPQGFAGHRESWRRTWGGGWEPCYE